MVDAQSDKRRLTYFDALEGIGKFQAARAATLTPENHNALDESD